MAWTNPLTWTDNELVTVDQFNTYIRDNLDALKNPPSTSYVLNESSDYVTAATDFTAVDGTNLALSITTGGGDVFVGFFGVVAHSSNSGRIYLDVFETVNNARIGGDDGIAVVQTANINAGISVAFLVRLSGVAAGTYEFRLQWKTNASLATMYAGAGTANFDLHPQFWAREMS